MSKSLYIAEKPSVALEFAKTLNIKGNKKDGFIESNEAVVTWCIGHLVTMSYPDKYDDKYKKWVLKDLPFLPNKYKYEVIKNVKKQFDIIKTLMKRTDISTIYVCTDSGREGEYIYRLVDEMVNVKGKTKKRVWIDSQTEEEIKKGVKNAKPLDEYDNLANAAYLRAKEDYLMGINFSRLLTLSYGSALSKRLGKKYVVIAVGRVMTCVLGMVVQREREIREFVKTPYYKIISNFQLDQSMDYDGEWKAIESSNYYMSDLLYKDIGFKEVKSAEKFIRELKEDNTELTAVVETIKKKKETKNPPLLYNLAELQNELSKKLKINPDETLKVAQKLYEKKMITYPRTDARVLSNAVAKEIHSNLKGLLRVKQSCQLEPGDEGINDFIQKIVNEGLYKELQKTKYVNDKAITDHYAIIPTGEGLGSFNRLTDYEKETFLLIVRRFLAIFYPPAIFSQLSITTKIKTESFFTTSKVCIQEGYLEILNDGKKDGASSLDKEETLKKLKKGQTVKINKLEIKESETTPPKRYSSGSIILAMESAGKLIEDEELREKIKGSGIGTSATRSGILNKLQQISYIALNKKTQILTPTSLGESIYDVVDESIPSLLKPELTASWEKGLGMIANGEIQCDEYMIKLEAYIRKNTQKVLKLSNQPNLLNSRSIKSTTNKGNQDTKGKRVGRLALGKCIACETGEVLENSKAFYCSNWKQNCKFTVWKDSLKRYEQEIDEEMIKALLEKGQIDKVSIVLPQTNEKCTASLEFKDNKKGELQLKNVTPTTE
ncbi:DNA topoisomerase, type IA, central domain protein [Alkaliphilus metalliredigens QYMF]|uniref:DNA topoisomerase n=1 Tax=Alkaliphilus metalliredigens (strain QYMF) TaxID=293826 RepID=A6TMD4_ALKMQ|nr:DNA topoisomerase [Alkaliphilus metalliredigens]ABR47352.1 DNA topoisomerase, type IA, central domain protein [Alkaliphilus metalliredigens QYMF]